MQETGPLIWSKTGIVTNILRRNKKNKVNLYKTATLKKDQKMVFKMDYVNAGQKYCRMLQKEHSEVLQNVPKGAFCNTFDLH